MNKKYDTRVLMQMIKDNRDKIDACPQHKFVIPKGGALKPGLKLTCSRCGGYMDAVQAFRYCQGFEAAGGNPNDVIENFK